MKQIKDIKTLVCNFKEFKDCASKRKRKYIYIWKIKHSDNKIINLKCNCHKKEIQCTKTVKLRRKHRQNTIKCAIFFFLALSPKMKQKQKLVNET